MATYTRTQTQTQASSSPLMPSVDLGSIIVRSLETSLKEIDTSDSTDLSKSITDGINNSVLGKQTGGSLANISKSKSGNVAALSKEEEALQKLKKKNVQDEDKQRKNLLKDMAKGYADLFKNLESNLKGTFDKTLSAVNTFTNNPLEGFDKGLQSIIKGSLGAVDKLMNTKISLPGKNNGGSKEDKEKLAPVTTLITEKSSQIEEQLKTLIGDTKTGNDKISSNLVQLQNTIKNNERKGEDRHKADVKEGVVKEKKRSQQAEKISEGIGVTNLVLGNIGQIITMVALAVVGGLAALPFIHAGIEKIKLWIVEKFSQFINVTIPTWLEKAKTFISVTFENLVDRIMTKIKPFINKISTLLIDMNPFKKDDEKLREKAAIMGISEDQLMEYNKNKAAISAYKSISEKKRESQKLEEELAALKSERESLEGEKGHYLKKNKLDAQIKEREKRLAAKEREITNLETGSKTFDVNGRKLTIAQMKEDEEFQKIYNIEKISEGAMGTSEEELKKREQERWDKANKTLAQNELERKFNEFINPKRVTLSALQGALNSGTWSPRESKETYTLTQSQRGKIQEAIANKAYREITKGEVVIAKAQSIGDTYVNTGQTLTHNVLKATDDGYMGDRDPSTQVIKDTGTKIYMNYSDTSMKNLAGK